MLMVQKLKPIGPYVIGQFVEYVGKPSTDQRRYTLSQRRWHVVQTEPQQETRVEGELEDRGFGSYLPRVPKKVRIVRERYRNVMRPMLTGYVLAGFGPQEVWQTIIDIRGVLRLFMVDGRPVPVGELEMQCLREAEERERQGKPRASKLIAMKAGDFVQVKDGPFASFFGMVAEVDAKKYRLKVDVDIFGRSTPITLDCDQVEVVLDSAARIGGTKRPQYGRPRSPR
jgi:transcriptional antiterminator NusG